MCLLQRPGSHEVLPVGGATVRMSEFKCGLYRQPRG